MIEARRKFVNSVLLLTGTIGLCKSIPVARACGATDDGPVYYPISHQLDFSQARLADYLKKYYGSELPLKQTDALIIQTEINPGATFAAQLDVEIPQQYIERNFDDIQCSHIDIFSQVMDGILEGPIYRIASYSLGQNTHPSIGLRYRRDLLKSNNSSYTH